jgi:hypothetical protein
MGWPEKQIEHLAQTFAVESAKTREALSAVVADTVRAQKLTGALPRPIQAGTLIYTVPGRLVGWSARAVSGQGGGRVTLYDATGPEPGREVAMIGLADGQVQTVPIMPTGVGFVTGLYAEVTGNPGAIVGVAWIGTD